MLDNNNYTDDFFKKKFSDSISAPQKIEWGDIENRMQRQQQLTYTKWLAGVALGLVGMFAVVSLFKEEGITSRVAIAQTNKSVEKTSKISFTPYVYNVSTGELPSYSINQEGDTFSQVAFPQEDELKIDRLLDERSMYHSFYRVNNRVQASFVNNSSK
ncbi:MAG: hypothetical protein AB8B61_02640 [Cyclobacteriaceae bacterium]